MLQSTITAVKMLISADPEADEATITRVVEACKKPQKRDLITSKEACSILGGITRMTLFHWTKKGILHPVRYSTKSMRYDRSEVEKIANVGVQ